MRAMMLEAAGKPLRLDERAAERKPEPGQVLIRVRACGVCRTDLHIIDGELDHPRLPLVPGHEIVGKIVKTGRLANELKPGDIVGVPWLAYTCGKCKYCKSCKENLCENAEFTGKTVK